MDLLVEQHQISPSNELYPEIKTLCHLTKNLYNATLYAVRQHYFNTKKYMNYYDVNRIFLKENNVDYRALPAKVAQQVQRKVDKNFKSFFTLDKKKNVGKYNKKIRIPGYLDKQGYFVAEYTNQAVYFRDNGYIQLLKSNIKIKTKVTKNKLQCVRIVPKCGYFVIEVCYKVTNKELKNDNNKYAAIDLGLNNLMTVTSTEFTPFIINGRPLKSINQRFNKNKARYQSKAQKCNKLYTTKRIQLIYRKRFNRIDDYLHKSVSYLMNQLVSHDIHTLIVGYNKEWKQDINLGKKNNQNFVEIPFYKLLTIISYKCKLEGIRLIIQEESYTSKCSFLDNESIEYHDQYMGNRIIRGLYKSANGTLINADVNGSYNIMKKYLLKEAKNVYDYIDLVKASSMPCKFSIVN